MVWRRRRVLSDNGLAEAGQVILVGSADLLDHSVQPQTFEQARTLEAPREGEGWLFLDWKEPLDSGKVAAYKIERRQRPSGPWTDACACMPACACTHADRDVGMAIESEITLSGQERGKEWEYRACLPRRLRRRQVIAVNKAGEGQPSNTVMAVL